MNNSYEEIKKLFFQNHKKYNKNHLTTEMNSQLQFYEDIDKFMMSLKTMKFKEPEVNRIFKENQYYKFYKELHKHEIREKFLNTFHSDLNDLNMVVNDEL